MKRQGLVFDYFIKTLDAEIASAKSEGKYDLGIKTLKGQKVTFNGPPQSFCFRGLTAPNETVELYSVQQDKGMSPEDAMKMYNELKESIDTENEDTVVDVTDSSNQGQGWFGSYRSRRKFDIQTGFYVDNRDYLTVTEKVFFIHSDPKAEKCLVARPNTGKKLELKTSLKKKFNNGAFSKRPVSVERAMKIWEREYELADCPYSDQYQVSCPGRHEESYVFAGSIVPVLNKILKAGRYYKDSEKTKKPFMVVRAEVSNAAELNADIIPQQAPSPDHGGDSDDEMLIADPVTGDEEDIGLGVARELANKTSKVRFRGTITKYHDDDKNPECDPSGTFFVKFSDGRKLTMDADQVNHGRRKFEKEVNRLVNCGMPREDASSMAEHTKGASLSRSKLRKPILDDGEEDPEEYERNFEQEFLDEVPESIVGLCFWRNGLHEMILEDLSKDLLAKGVETTRSLLNLEKMERQNAQKKED